MIGFAYRRMTHLFDLPNELILMIAAALRAESRRRFSKTCQRCFHLIRGQKIQDPDIKRRYDIRDFFAILKVRHVSKQECVLRFGCYDSHYPPSTAHRDDRVFCVVNADAAASAQLERYLSTECTIARGRVSWIRCADVVSELTKIVTEASVYICVYEMVYEAEFYKFSMELAEWIIRKMKTTCEFIILNDGFYSEDAHDVMEAILKTYLEVANTPEAAKKREWRSLKIFERYIRKCCPSVEEEDDKIDDSSHRLMEVLRGRRTKGGGEYVPQWFGLAKSTGRWMTLAFSHQDIALASLHMERNRIFHFRCPDYYQQLPEPFSSVTYHRELTHMHRDIVLKLQDRVEQHRQLLRRMELDPTHVQWSEVLPEMLLKWQKMSVKLQNMRFDDEIYQRRHQLWSMGAHTAHSM